MKEVTLKIISCVSGNYKKEYIAFKTTHIIIFCIAIKFTNLAHSIENPIILIYSLYRKKMMDIRLSEGKRFLCTKIILILFQFFFDL